MKSIISRLEELEKRSGGVLPLVIAEYQNGERMEYKGLPPIEDFQRVDNPIVQTSGSEFADLVNVIIHPVPNRNIEDFERGIT